MRQGAPFPEEPDNLHGFCQHVLPLVMCWPVVAKDMLVEVFTRPHTKKEASWHHGGCSCCCLGNYGRMDAYGRTRHASPQLQPFGGLGNTADYTPDKGTL